MKVLFIHTDIHRYDPREYGFSGLIHWNDMQFGISYISSYLKANGHVTKLFFINNHDWEKSLAEYLTKFRPSIAGLGGVSTQFRHVFKIAEFMKAKFPDIYLIYGGVHATLAGLDLAKLPFNAICRGEGEAPMLELVEKLEKKKSPHEVMNLTVRKNGNIFRNKCRNFIQALDKMPFPDRKMWKDYVTPHALDAHAVLLSRGCPFECTYCSNKALKETANGQYVRFRKPEKIVEELKCIKKEYPAAGEAYLETEMITANLPWFRDMCEELYKLNIGLSVPFSFASNIRVVPGTDYRSVFGMMKQAGFGQVNIGIESGSEKIRKKVLNRNYSNKDVISVFEEARAHGISPHAYNMIGLPGETPEDFRETVKLNRICQPEDPHLAVFFPYPKTALFEKCRKDGLLRPETNCTEERQETAIRTERFPARAVRKYYARFEWDVYRGKKNAFSLLKRYLYKRYIIQHKALLRIYVFLTKTMKGFYINIPGKPDSE